MLFARRLETDTKGLTVYETLKDFLQQQRIPMNNIIACATDGAASMVGKYQDLSRPMTRNTRTEARTERNSRPHPAILLKKHEFLIQNFEEMLIFSQSTSSQVPAYWRFSD